jgi:hypothetical protein
MVCSQADVSAPSQDETHSRQRWGLGRVFGMGWAICAANRADTAQSAVALSQGGVLLHWSETKEGRKEWIKYGLTSGVGLLVLGAVAMFTPVCVGTLGLRLLAGEPPIGPLRGVSVPVGSSLEALPRPHVSGAPRL